MSEADTSSGLRERFERDGFLHIKAFCTRDQCANMQSSMGALIDAWDPDKTMAPIFSTDEKEQQKAQGDSDYFLDSADRVHFFLEKGAVDDEGKLRKDVPKARALNKVGHGLHVVDDAFREYSQSQKVADLVAALGWRDPVLPQSMYIFKQPDIGGEVTSHQDSSFLHTTPRPTCLGLWLALDAATLQNGCLWARPGSHLEPVRRVFVRNPAHFESGDASASKMIFEDSADTKASAAWTWEGKMPGGWEPPSEGLREKGFLPIECEVGDLVVIHGQVDHLSLPNTSKLKRDTFQLHLVEGPTQGITWSKKNWLQYPAGKTFPRLGTTCGTKRKASDMS